MEQLVLGHTECRWQNPVAKRALADTKSPTRLHCATASIKISIGNNE